LSFPPVDFGFLTEPSDTSQYEPSLAPTEPDQESGGEREGLVDGLNGENSVGDDENLMMEKFGKMGMGWTLLGMIPTWKFHRKSGPGSIGVGSPLGSSSESKFMMLSWISTLVFWMQCEMH
jgi:hypothetical protein